MRSDLNREKTIAIIPARGNSKRLPGKNLLYLGGKTLLEHSIDFALANTGIIDRVVVSTDSIDIKRVALAAKIEVIDRPAELATDTTSTIDVLKHVQETIGAEYKDIIVLQPTNPLRPADLLKDAFERYVRGNFDSLMTVSPEIRKLGKIIDQKFVPFNYSIGQRSQDMDPLYFENGLLYISKADQIHKGFIMGEKNLPFLVEHPFAKVDIDVKDDLEYARYIYNKYCK